jgi:hypothetical protein
MQYILIAGMFVSLLIPRKLRHNLWAKVERLLDGWEVTADHVARKTIK